MVSMWIGLFALVIIILFIDLGVVHRHGRHLSLKASVGWTLLWMAVGAAFSGVVYWAWTQGHVPNQDLTSKNAALDYLTCWVLEFSLSLDNIFVMALIFKRWRVEEDEQHTVLFYGILGAVGLRTVMIIFGAQIIDRFVWLIPTFGLYLVYQGGKTLYEYLTKKGDKAAQKPLPEKFIGIALIQPTHHGHFFEKLQSGKWALTTLAAALLAIEGADLLFAVDSIPAALSITNHVFLVISSNVLAIIGLRSLYSVLAGVLDRYNDLHISLSLILIFIGVKMGLMILDIHIPNPISLSVLLVLLVGGFAYSVAKDRRQRANEITE